MSKLKVIEHNTYPVTSHGLVVYPEYFTTFDRIPDIQRNLGNQIGVIGIGVHNEYTSVVVTSEDKIIGARRKISIFHGEDSKVSPTLQAFDIGKVRLGVVICREVLHTAIAEIYRMMGVNLLAVSISGGDFKGMQRASWIDQMVLFSDIVGCPLICASGADKAHYGLNLVIDR